MDSFYLVLNSNSSKNYFELNTSNHFKNKLLNSVSLDGEWEVSLFDIQYFNPLVNANNHSIWIYSDIVVHSQVGNVSVPLLRKISINSLNNNNWLLSEPSSFYVKLRTNYLDIINIDIKDNIEQSFDSLGVSSQIDNTKPTSLTLHFKKI